MILVSKGDIPVDILEEIITLGEGYKTEFKVTLPAPQAFAKSVCAFTNARGGNLFVGIDDSGVPVGISNKSNELAIIEKALPLLLPKPDIKVLIFSFKEKEILYIEVKEGPNKPYYVREGNLTNAYIRAADVNLPASKKALRDFINGSSSSKRGKRALRKNVKIIYELFSQNKKLSVSRIRETLNYSERRIRKLLSGLVKRGFIIPSYNEKNVYYRTEDR
jgi:predicted HTH transcriptional regulator